VEKIDRELLLIPIMGAIVAASTIANHPDLVAKFFRYWIDIRGEEMQLAPFQKYPHYHFYTIRILSRIY